jgi:HEPN domain-containing protein
MPAKLFRSDLQRLAECRLNEAQLLLKSRRYHGAYYIGGYSVELGLKAVIASKVRRYSFPTQDDVFTHKLLALTRLAGLGNDQAGLLSAALGNGAFKSYWQTVVKWGPEARYSTEITKHEARDLLQAISDPSDGVLQWIRGYW